MEFTRETQLLHSGDRVDGIDLSTEALPIYTTSAFTWHSLYEAQAGYKAMREGHGFAYGRTANPNRNALAQSISLMENGESTIICNSGMSAISSTLLTLLKAGDHVVYSNCCYGESMTFFQKVLSRFGVAATAVPIDNLEAVKAAIRPETTLIYAETMANPCMNVADIPALAELIHANGGKLLVDNTFTTPLAIRPLEMGADVVVNSLTKFINGHSDAILGAVTGPKDLVTDVLAVSKLVGSPGDPFTTWLVSRSIRTVDLRVPVQMANAAALARALEADPRVEKVYHPALESFAGHETAMRLYPDEDHMCPMMSIVLPEDLDKMNDFMSRLHLAAYAPTLGGVRTTYQHPCTSSHSHTPDDQRRAAGITPGMVRISVGCENIKDLIADFTQALDAFN